MAQALLETFSNPLITTTNYLGDKLYGLLFKGIREFNLASYTEAISMVGNPASPHKALIEAISNTYGITNADTDVIKKMMNQLKTFKKLEKMTNQLKKLKNLIQLKKLKKLKKLMR